MPHGPVGDRIPFEGVLNCWNDDHDLPDLLLAIARSGKTGRLQFSNPEGDKTLDLRGGKIVFAESSSQDDGLGQYLLRTGKITLMDYTRVSRLVQPGKRLGALLIDANILAAEDLIPAVAGQVRSVILGLFRRTETWYRFREQELEEKEANILELAVPELILEGVRYVESWRRVSKGAGSLESVYQQTSAREQEWLSSHLDDDVRELVDMLAAPTSLQEICTRATLPDFEACRYLWAFRALGWIDLVDEAAQVDSAPSIAPEAEAAAPPTRAPADTPTRPSIERPVAASIPPELTETRVAMEPPTRPTPPEIPASLIQTQLSVAPPTKSDEDLVVEEPAPPAPTPVPEHLNQTQIAISPPSPTSPATPTAIPEELLHTQMYVEAPASAPIPRSTGEFMESILEGEDPTPATTAPAAAEPPPVEQPPPMQPEPPPAENHAATQFFEGSSALVPMDSDLTSPPPTELAEPEPPPPPAPRAGTPSGFEALALGGGPDGPSVPAPSGPRPPHAIPPSPADVVTQPSVQPPPPTEGGAMTSFSDLAPPEEPPAQDPVPLVEAEVIVAEPAFPPEEPLLPPPVGGPPVQNESLIPRRRHGDEPVANKEDFGHVLGDDD